MSMNANAFPASHETLNDSVRRAMMETDGMTTLRAAAVVRTHTGAKLTALSLNDAGGARPGWLLEGERLDASELFTDAGLIDYATKLERIYNDRSPQVQIERAADASTAPGSDLLRTMLAGLPRAELEAAARLAAARERREERFKVLSERLDEVQP